MYIRTCIHMYVHRYMYIRMYTHMYIIYIQLYTYIHTYIHKSMWESYKCWNYHNSDIFHLICNIASLITLSLLASLDHDDNIRGSVQLTEITIEIEGFQSSLMQSWDHNETHSELIAEIDWPFYIGLNNGNFSIVANWLQQRVPAHLRKDGCVRSNCDFDPTGNHLCWHQRR